MPCTTLLVGKNASYDGSTLIARDHDSGANHYEPKKFIVVPPDEQPRHYTSKISHLSLELEDNPMRYTSCPNVIEDHGVWASAGFNELNISMTATETITSNERVLGADPLVYYRPPCGDQPEIPGGIGEEDMVTIILPYIRSAREGVLRLGDFIEKYGTYEMNGIAFQDLDEVWWFETVGGHHWIAKRVPDDSYVVAPNWFNIVEFDLEDAFGNQTEHLCSSDLIEFINENHLSQDTGRSFNARAAFGSHTDGDRTYNTPRAWAVQRFFNPRTCLWDGPDADYIPEDTDMPWAMVPERRITIEDVKYALSNYFQNTPYNPYKNAHPLTGHGPYRPIGINRNGFLSIHQLRPYAPEEIRAIEWLTYGSNTFNSIVPFYGNINSTPEYLSNTTEQVSTDSFYWANRLIAAIADPNFRFCKAEIYRYQLLIPAKGHNLIKKYDAIFNSGYSGNVTELLEKANQEIADMLKDETDRLLSKLLFIASNHMTNSFSKEDS